ncbi:CAP domain-containing protein [Sphingomonas sp. LT1P40]|uniref:CAP domain-containing protein n=1 Tax=Alteristakelama amylovorans TaxID=3096166 RepID=UPI002FCB3B96
MLLLPLLLLAACSPQQEAPPPERFVEQRPFEGDAARGAERMQTAMMTMHNTARASARVPELIWDDALARDAEGYAKELARRGKFEHSKQPRGNPPQGENLWTGTRGAYRYDEMAQHWIDERRHFVNAAIPNVSRTGKFADVGHYTQIVWRGTTRVGCGFASNKRDDYLVCRYLAAGNVWGQKAL